MSIINNVKAKEEMAANAAAQEAMKAQFREQQMTENPIRVVWGEGPGLAQMMAEAPNVRYTGIEPLGYSNFYVQYPYKDIIGEHRPAWGGAGGQTVPATDMQGLEAAMARELANKKAYEEAKKYERDNNLYVR